MNKKILIVEDEAIIADRMKSLLIKNGYTVTQTVDNFEDAIASLEKDPVDLILMDIVIKGPHDGIDTAMHIQNTFHLPVIFLTAYSDDNTLQRAELAHAYGYLIKPINEDELKAMIRVVLKRHSRDKELLKTISEVKKHTDILSSSMSRLSNQAEDYNNVRLEDDLQYALERKQLELYYQPQVNILTHKIIGMEALLRWNHPSMGQISPSVFIPKLEHTGLILEVGHWVLNQACQQLDKWSRENSDNLVMSVNISSKQLHSGSLEEQLNIALSDYHLNPRFLDLEITETILLNHDEKEIETFENLRSIGVQISIDDFGTGYSGLSYLQSFPFDALKIDRQFIHNIDSNANHSAIAIAIINLAKELGLSTVAEGVETKEELEFLLHHGCEIVQGYYFSRAVSAENFNKLLTEGI